TRLILVWSKNAEIGSPQPHWPFAPSPRPFLTVESPIRKSVGIFGLRTVEGEAVCGKFARLKPSNSPKAITRTIRFFTCLSSRLRSLSALEVVVTLYIDLTGLPHLFDDLRERTPRLIGALAGDPAQVEILQHLFVLFYRNDHRSAVSIGIDDEL